MVTIYFYIFIFNITNIVIILGKKKSFFNEGILPTKKDVLCRLQYLAQDESKTYNEGAYIISDDLIGIYNAFQIPVSEKKKH